MIQLLALLAAVPAAALLSGASRAEANACDGIQFGYHETIEAQGFLGLATPNASWKAVYDGLDRNIQKGWIRHRYRQKPVSWLDYQRQTPMHLRERTEMRFLTYRFEMSDLCTLAKRKGFRKLTFACRADTGSNEVRETETGWFNTGYESRKSAHGLTHQFSISRTRTVTRDEDWTMGECFISTFAGKDPDFDDLLAHRWGPLASNRDWQFYEDFNADMIDSPDYRTSLYTELIHHIVNWTVIEETEGKGLRASGLATRSTTPAERAGAGCTPQRSAQPIAMSALPWLNGRPAQAQSDPL